MIKLTKDQDKALKTITDWYLSKSRSPFLTLGGYAGTGKTTLIALFRGLLNKEKKDAKVAFCSFTGKATRVLKQTLVENKFIYKSDNISTIHSLIYSPIVNNGQDIVGWEKKEKINFDLIIADEASMIDQSIWNDLLGYHIPILAVGDHGQLPPINGSFNLMSKPQIKLEEIHRQRKGDPIIDISILARHDGFIPVGKYGDSVIKISRTSDEGSDVINEILNNFTPGQLILCGYNVTRLKLNKFIRSNLGFYSDSPQANDRVICLRNNHEKNIYNGMLGTIKSIEDNDDDTKFAHIEFDDEDATYKGYILSEQFNNKESLNFTNKRHRTLKSDLFDFGYALTVHKAQGSQASNVILFEERFAKMDDETWRRWLYTGVTRAQDKLVIVGS